MFLGEYSWIIDEVSRGNKMWVRYNVSYLIHRSKIRREGIERENLLQYFDLRSHRSRRTEVREVEEQRLEAKEEVERKHELLKILSRRTRERESVSEVTQICLHWYNKYENLRRLA